MWLLFSVMVSKDWEIHLGHMLSQATVIWAAQWYCDPGLKKNILLRRWVEWEDMNTVIKGAIKCAYFCLRNVPSVMETISIQLCTLLYFAKQVPSFLTTGISGSSGLPSCIYLMAQRACWNTGKHFLIRKPCQICLLPDACHQAMESFFSLTELCLGSQSFQICDNLGSVFSPPNTLSVVAFFQSISRCGCIFVLFPSHCILSWTSA